MARAEWNGVLLAESDAVHVVEGNIYFPPGAVAAAHLHESATTSRCVWKGKANYFDVEVAGERLTDAAWTYRAPWPLARKLKDHVAFWRGVVITP